MGSASALSLDIRLWSTVRSLLSLFDSSFRLVTSQQSASTVVLFDSPVCDRGTGHCTVAVCEKQVVVAGLINQRTPQKALLIMHSDV